MTAMFQRSPPCSRCEIVTGWLCKEPGSIGRGWCTISNMDEVRGADVNATSEFPAQQTYPVFYKTHTFLYQSLLERCDV